MNIPNMPLLACDPQVHDAIDRAIDGMRRRLARTDSRSPLMNLGGARGRGRALTLLPGDAGPLAATLRADPRGLELRAIGRDPRKAQAPAMLDSAETAHLPRLLLKQGAQAADASLTRLARAAREAEAETGANLLALALGSVTWVAGDAEGGQRVAPVILIPARLMHMARENRWILSPAENEAVFNHALAEMLQHEFDGMTGPLAPTPIDEDRAFDEVGALIAQRECWQLDRRSRTLALFSHVNDLIYRDLGHPAFTAEAHRSDAPLHRVLTGVKPHNEGNAAEGHDRPDTPFELDPSQARVVAAAREGRSFVVSGPPGTGKSQTISAIVAGAAAAGKTVLFLAQKQVALDVVRQKLEAAGHGGLIVRLYGDATTAGTVRAQVDRVWREMPTTAPPMDRNEEEGAGASLAHPDPASIFSELSDALHGVAQEGCDVSAWEALGALAAMASASEPVPQVELPHLARISRSEAHRLEAALHEFAEQVVVSGPRAEHPWAGTTRRDLLPTDIERLLDRLSHLAPLLQQICEAGAEAKKLARRTGTDLPALEGLLIHRRDAPQIVPDLAKVLWARRNEPALTDALTAISEWKQDAPTRAARFAPEAEHQDSRGLRDALFAGTRALMPALSRPYRVASDSLAALVVGPLPLNAAARYTLLLDLLAVQAGRRAITSHERSLVAAGNGMAEPDADACRACLTWVRRLAELAPRMHGDGVFALLSITSAQARRIVELPALAEAIRDEAAMVLSLLGWPGPETIEDAIRTARRMDRLARHMTAYPGWTALTAHASLIDSAGLERFATLIEDDGLRPDEAVRQFRYALAEARWRAAMKAAPQLGTLRDLDRDALISRWTENEGAERARASARLKKKHVERMPTATDPDRRVRLFRRELGRKAGHLTLCQLMRGAGPLIQQIHPVFLATPHSVARLMPCDAMRFDLVVIDEASQMRPEFALGGIARADQVIVCGDDKQLPPMDFFERAFTTGDGDAVTQPGPPKPADTVEMESILTLARASGLDEYMLNTHYRSRAASLIATSNRLFYGGKLIVPPSPRDGQAGYGLSLTRVDGVYQRGAKGETPAGTNPIEAEHIAQAVARHARRRTASSIGVATFSVAQRDMVLFSLERLRSRDPVLDAWFAARDDDPQASVFVKNLEDVQGDERDVILISIGYGPVRPGGRLASQNFGPVNRAGGERRLNTLFTRAREACSVFCSFDPTDIDADAAAHAGPMVLKRFLEAAAAPAAVPQPDDAPEDTLREDIADAISRMGLRCTTGLGPAPHSIDIAVSPQESTRGEAVAVLLDSANGYGTCSERERMILRERVLRDRGWRIHRIWGSDWYNYRQQEVQRLRRALFDEAVPHRR